MKHIRTLLIVCAVFSLTYLSSCGLDETLKDLIPTDDITGSYKVTYGSQNFLGSTFIYVQQVSSDEIEIIPYQETGHPSFIARMVKLTNGNYGLEINSQSAGDGVVTGNIIPDSDFNGVYNTSDGTIIYLITYTENDETEEISVITTEKTNSPQSCFNLSKDSDEAGIDCGGNCPYTCSSSSYFETLKESASDETFRTIDFYNDQIGLVYAHKTVSSVFYKTVNGGNSWSTINSPTTVSISNIRFITSSSVYIEAQDGTVFHSSDGGSNWTIVSNFPFGSTNFGFMYAITETKWVTGGQNNNDFQYTEDAGTTWTPATVNMPGVPEGATAFDVTHFYSETSGYTFFRNSGNGKMYFLKTTNSGKTWDLVSQPVSSPVNSVHFTDANNGLAVGDFEGVLKTTNGGVTWSLVETDNMVLSGVYQSGSTAIIVGDKISYSNNNGSTWTLTEDIIYNYIRLASAGNIVFAISPETVVKIDLTDFE